MSGPAGGQPQPLQPTSDVTSKFPGCSRASVVGIGIEALAVATRHPPDDDLQLSSSRLDTFPISGILATLVPLSVWQDLASGGIGAAGCI